MDDMISRAAAIELIENRQRKLCPVGMFSRNAVYGSDREKFDCWQEIIDEIERLPAADAVPVVRCKDCRHYAIYQLKSDYTPDRRYNPSVCLRGEFARLHSPDWYCADGERRDDE